MSERYPIEGMRDTPTLLDQFAMAALTGIVMAMPGSPDEKQATMAYGIAREMMRIRKFPINR